MKNRAIIITIIVLLMLIAMPEIKVVDQHELTTEMLVTRKENRIIYIQRTVGEVINKEKDGRILNAADPEFDYISYTGVKRIKKGDRIVTYCVFNPVNNYIDDIVLRLDFVQRRENYA